MIVKGLKYTHRRDDYMKKSDAHTDEIWEVGWTYIRAVAGTFRESFIIQDEDLRGLSASRTSYTLFQTTPKDTEGREDSDAKCQIVHICLDII